MPYPSPPPCMIVHKRTKKKTIKKNMDDMPFEEDAMGMGQSFTLDDFTNRKKNGKGPENPYMYFYTHAIEIKLLR